MGTIRGDEYEAAEIHNAVVACQINQSLEPPQHIDGLDITTDNNKKRKHNS